MNDQLGSSNQRHGGLPTHDEWERNAQPGGASVFVQSTDTREPCCDTTLGPHEQQNTFPEASEWHEESASEDDSADKDLEKAERSSLDEQVLFLQQRHSVMHNTGDPEKVRAFASNTHLTHVWQSFCSLLYPVGMLLNAADLFVLDKFCQSILSTAEREPKYKL